MKKLLLAGALLALAALPARADIIADGVFASDHCNCTGTGQPGGFATIQVTDHQNGTMDILINMLNGNTFANGGQGAGFAFNLVGNPTITYTNLGAQPFDVVNSATNVQNAGVVAMNGFGTFEYGLDGTFQGSQGPTSLSFTISGTGLSLASFAELSTNPPGDTRAFMALDIASFNANGNTGIVDLSAVPTPRDVAVPGPVVGAGLPGLIAACVGLWSFAKRRRSRLV